MEEEKSTECCVCKILSYKGKESIKILFYVGILHIILPRDLIYDVITFLK